MMIVKVDADIIKFIRK